MALPMRNAYELLLLRNEREERCSEECWVPAGGEKDIGDAGSASSFPLFLVFV